MNRRLGIRSFSKRSHTAAHIDGVRFLGFQEEGAEGLGDDGGADDVGVHAELHAGFDVRVAAADCSVVDEHVKAAVLLLDVGCGARDGGGVGDVELDC